MSKIVDAGGICAILPHAAGISPGELTDKMKTLIYKVTSNEYSGSKREFSKKKKLSAMLAGRQNTAGRLPSLTCGQAL